jgi:hypothetical protein
MDKTTKQELIKIGAAFAVIAITVLVIKLPTGAEPIIAPIECLYATIAIYTIASVVIVVWAYLREGFDLCIFFIACLLSIALIIF